MKISKLKIITVIIIIIIPFKGVQSVFTAEKEKNISHTSDVPFLSKSTITAQLLKYYTMNTLEQLIYIQHTKSATKSFENFVDALMKHNDVLSDAELINSMQRISKKLQTVTSKWDSKLAKLSPIEKHGSLSKTPSLEDVLSITAPSTDDVVCFRNRSRSSTLSLPEFDPKPGCSYKVSTTDYDEEKSISILFKDINENLIVGADGFYVEEVTSGFWKCKACDANNLPLNNLLSHVNGKSHKKRINFKSL